MPAHNSKKTQHRLKEYLRGVWERRRSGPKALQLKAFFVFGVSEFIVVGATHKKTAALIARIKEMMGSLDRDIVARVCRRFWSRIELVIVADGNFIE